MRYSLSFWWGFLGLNFVRTTILNIKGESLKFSKSLSCFLNSCFVLYSNLFIPVNGSRKVPRQTLPGRTFPRRAVPQRHFLEGQFPKRTIPRTDISLKDSFPNEISPNGYFPESNFIRLFKSLFTVGIQK